MIDQTNRLARDLGLLALRATVGGLLAGHGAQKLFGSFGGHGVEGTAGWLETLGLRPGKPWALLAGASELGGGTLTALGLLHPLGPIGTVGPMVMAWNKAHAGKPIWVTSGGAELPLLNLAAAAALTLTGPGRISLDQLLGLRVPRALVALSAAGVAAGIAAGVMARPQAEPEAEGAAGAGSLTGAAGTDSSDDLHPSATALGVGADPLTGAPAEDEGRRFTESGMATYGGIGMTMDPDLPELAKEVGADPPGGFGPDWRPTDQNPRREGDDHGQEDPRPRR